MLIKVACSTRESLISVVQSLNGAQFLNAAFVLLPAEVIFCVTKIYASV